MGLIDMGVQMALNRVQNNLINPKLADIGKVEEISFKNGKLFVKLRLEGLEDRPIEVACEDVRVSSDGSQAAIYKFTANMKFIQTALDLYMVGRPIEIPKGTARMAVCIAKKVLGLEEL